MKSTGLFGGGTVFLLCIVALFAFFAPPIFAYAVGSVLLVGEISLLGVFALSIQPATLTSLTQTLVSLATGCMLGNAFVHLIPESFENVTDCRISALAVSLLMSAGFFVCFVMEKGLNFSCHHAGACHHAPEQCADCDCEKKEQGSFEAEHDHVECSPVEHEHDHHKQHGHIHPTGHLSLMAHGMDNFTDGMLIGLAFLISPAAGVAMTIAIVSHEIPMEFGGFGVLVNAGYTRFQAVLINFLSAMCALAGTLLVLVLGTVIKALPVYLTPFGTGVAIYIVASGLVPMLHKERDLTRSLIQSGILLFGFAAMVAAKVFEIWLGA